MGSVVDSVPNELWCSIFEFAHAAIYSDGYSSSHKPVELEISKVSRGWRDLSLSMPNLWAVYRCINPTTGMLNQEGRRLQVYLERSDGADLELSFQFAELDPSAAANPVNKMLHSTLAHISRWCRFVAISDGSDGGAINNFHRPLKRLSAPKLEYMDVRTSAWHDYETVGWDTEPHWNPKLFHGDTCPIRYLRLDGCAAMARWRPSFDNIVHFLLEEGLGWQSIGVVLLFSNLTTVLQLPNLETISIWGTNYEQLPSQALPGGVIRANRLRHIRYGKDTCTSTLAFLLNRLSAPVLETITIQDINISPALGFLDPPDDHKVYSFPSLRSLFLIDVDFHQWTETWSIFRYNPTYSGGMLRDLVSRLAQTTRRASHLTISNTHPESYSILEFFPGRKLSHYPEGQSATGLCPSVEDLTLNFQPGVLPASDLLWQTMWPKVKRLSLPRDDSGNPWPHASTLKNAEGSSVRVEQVKSLGHRSWPPVYRWTSSNEDTDPFIRGAAF